MKGDIELGNSGFVQTFFQMALVTLPLWSVSKVLDRQADPNSDVAFGRRQAFLMDSELVCEPHVLENLVLRALQGRTDRVSSVSPCTRSTTAACGTDADTACLLGPPRTS